MSPMNPRLLVPRATGFNPKSISGLALWLDAADGSTLFQNSDGTTPATATSDPVGYWRDKSGNNRHATQATAGSRPTLGSQNGRKALVANGTSHEMALTNAGDVVRNKPGATMIAVLVPNTVASIRTAAFWSVGTSAGARSLLQFNNAELRAGGRRLDADSFDSATGGTIVANQPIVAVARLDYANANAIAYSNSVPFATDTSFLTAGLTSDTASQAAAIMNSTGGSLFYSGTFAELLTYDRALTDSERRKIELHLARKWGITLAPQVSNLDAQDWVNRVYANGGTVSTATANAVNSFCDSIDAAGIRDRFFRLNLFAGTGLNACLVPLYRGQSRTGTQFGNTTDTNVGPFVSGDYAENDGLLGATSPGKYLRTGISPDDVGVATGHLSTGVKASAASDFALAIGANNSGSTERFNLLSANTNAFQGNAITDFMAQSRWGGTSGTVYATAGSAVRPSGLYIFTRTSSTRTDFYLAGVSVANSTASVTPGANANEFYVMAQNINGSPNFTGSTRARGYSIGASLSGAQAAAYDAAWTAMQTALGRT
jgi:hypothetical protein